MYKARVYEKENNHIANECKYHLTKNDNIQLAAPHLSLFLYNYYNTYLS